MSATGETASEADEAHGGTTDLKLEVVVIPVADVDRAKEFYRDSAGGWTPTSPSTTASGSSSSRRPVRGPRCSSARRSPRPSPARRRACTWSSPTSRPPATSWPRAAPRSARCSTRSPGRAVRADASGQVRGRAPTGPATARSRPSPTRTATAGCCRRSRRGCPAASTRPRRPTPPLRTWRPRFGERRPRTASTRSAPAEADANWPDWYAAYMVAEQSGTELPRHDASRSWPGRQSS